MGWQIAVQLLLLFFREVIKKGRASDDCPGGICDDAEIRVAHVETALSLPSTTGLFDFFGCVPLTEWIALGRRWVVLIRDAMNCGSPIKDLAGFLDCVDLVAAIELIKDTIELIAKAMQCDGGEVSNPDAPVPQ